MSCPGYQCAVVIVILFSQIFFITLKVMKDREPSPGADIEINTRQEAVAPAIGETATTPAAEVIFAEMDTHGSFPNQLLLIPRDGMKDFHQQITIS